MVSRSGYVLNVGGCMRIIDTPNRLCSIPGFNGVLPIKDPENKPYWTALDAFVYALNAQNFNGSRVSINDENATPRWPEDDFIQPLNGAGVAAPATNDGTGFPRFKDKIDTVVNKDKTFTADTGKADSEATAASAMGHLYLTALLGLLLLRRKLATSNS